MWKHDDYLATGPGAHHSETKPHLKKIERGLSFNNELSPSIQAHSEA